MLLFDGRRTAQLHCAYAKNPMNLGQAGVQIGPGDSSELPT